MFLYFQAETEIKATTYESTSSLTYDLVLNTLGYIKLEPAVIFKVICDE